MDWASIFIYDTTWSFAAEIVIRVIIMFSMIILFLRFTGKRSVRQLSIFELTIILSLGSIAGDPMFTEDLPLIQAVLIMSMVIALYRLCTWTMMKYQPFEDFIEGRPIYIVEEGQLVLDKIEQGEMSHDEFFAEMRQQGIEHLGQIRYGLPLFPKQYQAVKQIDSGACYACMHCGYVDNISKPNQTCARCECNDWAQAINVKVIE
jgi:hypothetical protein